MMRKPIDEQAAVIRVTKVFVPLLAFMLLVLIVAACLAPTGAT
jgi:hypothetical protein